MRRKVGLIQILVLWLMVALAGGVGPVVAQETPPSTQQLPEGVVATPLARHEVETMPAPPAYIGLARISLAPNAAGPVERSVGLTLFSVASGTVLFGSFDVFNGAVASPTTQASGVEEVQVAAGEEWFADPGVQFTIRNAGAEPAEILRIVLSPGAPPTSFSPGARFERLAFGVALTLPTGPATVALHRVTLVPGSSVPTRAEIGPVLLYIESGTALLTSSGVESTLAPGTSAFIQLGALAAVRAVGDAPLVLLAASVVVAAADAATPMPGTPAP